MRPCAQTLFPHLTPTRLRGQDLLLHHLFQRPQQQRLGLLQRHVLAVRLRQRALRPLAPGPDGLGLGINANQWT